MIVALSKIYDADPTYLLTGEEHGETTHYSEEAEQIAKLVDQMQPQTRQMMLGAARGAMQLESELMEAYREIARLLEENISLLSNGDRMIADAYIDRIGHRNARQ